MSLPIPMEAVTMLAGAGVGGLMKMWGMKAEIESKKNEYLYKMSTLKNDSFQAVREIKDVKFQWTRRIIALTLVFSVILLPKLVAIFSPGTEVVVGWTQWNPGFLFFAGNEEIMWKSVTGLVITPLDTHLMSLVGGLYFGGSLVGHNK